MIRDVIVTEEIIYRLTPAEVRDALAVYVQDHKPDNHPYTGVTRSDCVVLVHQDGSADVVNRYGAVQRELHPADDSGYGTRVYERCVCGHPGDTPTCPIDHDQIQHEQADAPQETP